MNSLFPPNLRCAFYSLPLLFSWVFGVTWETAERPRLAAKRGMLLSLLFLLALGAEFFMAGPLAYLFPEGEGSIAYGLYLSHNAFIFLYFFCSFVLALTELLGKPLQNNFVDRLTDKMEWLLSF